MRTLQAALVLAAVHTSASQGEAAPAADALVQAADSCSAQAGELADGAPQLLQRASSRLQGPAQAPALSHQIDGETSQGVAHAAGAPPEGGKEQAPRLSSVAQILGESDVVAAVMKPTMPFKLRVSWEALAGIVAVLVLLVAFIWYYNQSTEGALSANSTPATTPRY